MKISHIFVSIMLIVTAISPVSANEEKPDLFDFIPSPAIWKLADEDTTIYMFGTVHLLPRDLKWRTEKFDAIVREVDELVVETSDADFESMGDDEDMWSLIMGNKAGTPLIERVRPENQTALKALAKYIGMPLVVLDEVPTWVIPFMYYFKSIEGAEATGEYGYGYGVETVLEAEFASMDKPVISIEEPTAILAALTNMPDDQQIIMVDQLLEEWETAETVTKTDDTDDQAGIQNKTKSADNSGNMLDYSEDIGWAKGDLTSVAVGLSKEELGEGFYNILITERNTAWTEWLEDRLQKPGKILLAVGTGHFVGEHALLKMLAEKGLKVDRLQ